jgi:hypothetical protein
MKINADMVIKRLNGVPVTADQEPGSQELTVGGVISTILSTKKVDQFNPLKAYSLAQRFYKGGLIEIDEGDYSSLRQVIENNDQYVPFVLAQVLQALIEAKDKQIKK